MVNKQKNDKKKWAIWVLVPILFVVAGIITYFVCVNIVNDKKKDEVVPEQNSAEPGRNVTKKDDKKKEEEVVQEEPKVKQYEGEDPNLNDELSGVITYAGVNSDILRVRVNIDQFVVDGICKLTLVQNENAVFGASTAMIENASTATCDGFDVPIQGFESGQTTIVVDLEANGKSGQLIGEVEI